MRPVASVVAVVDVSGSLIFLARQDGAVGLATKWAIRKAQTSARLGLASGDFWDGASGQARLAAAITGDPELLAIKGGVPVIYEGELVGAIGISGGSDIDDEKIALVGLTTAKKGNSRD
jgi:glc operon protein GlcG